MEPTVKRGARDRTFSQDRLDAPRNGCWGGVAAQLWALIVILLFSDTRITAGPVYEPIVGFPETPTVPGSLLLHSDGNIYACSDRVLYRLTPTDEFTAIGRFAERLTVPIETLATGADGYFWGATKRGGAADRGSVFTINFSNGKLKTVFSFALTSPWTSGPAPIPFLASDGNGFFWGATGAGGAANVGTIFKISESSHVVTSVADFTGRGGPRVGARPQTRLVSDGKNHMWGTTAERLGAPSSIYKVSTKTGAFTTVAKWPFVYNPSPLVNDGNGGLWGLTGDGRIFKIEIASGQFSVVTEISIPAVPPGEVPPKLVSDGLGKLWGTTRNGTLGGGSIFKIDTSTGAVTTVVEFDGSNGYDKSVKLGELVNDGAGHFWSIARNGGVRPGYPDVLYDPRGILFRVEIATGALTTIQDFGTLPGDASTPYSKLVSDGAGNVWGTLARENKFDGYTGGAIYKVSASDNTFTEVVQFTATPTSADGPYPGAILVSDQGGSLWGVARGHGEGYGPDYGLIYKVNPENWETTAVVEFTGLNGPNKGSFPQSLISDGAGYLWGTLFSPSSIFKVNASTGEFTSEADFPPDRFGSLSVADGAGNFWGWSAYGMLFKFNSRTGELKYFTAIVDSGDSWGPLVSDGIGNLWTTTSTGKLGTGAIWRIDPGTGEPTPVVSFAGPAHPTTLCSDGAGKLWGVIGVGLQGVYEAKAPQPLPGHRAIFKVNATSKKLTYVSEFGGVAQSNREITTSPLVYDGAGNFYGTTEFGGASDLGTIFRFSRTQGFSTLFEFTGEGGPVPGAHPAPTYPSVPTLVRHSDGNLYGMTSAGGVLADGQPTSAGQAYRIRFGPTPVTGMADELGTTTAMLRGTLNPNGTDTKAAFEYGPAPALGIYSMLEAGKLDAGSTPRSVSASVSDLAPGTTYYFRVLGENPENSYPQRGAIESFTTLATTPTGFTEPAQ